MGVRRCLARSLTSLALLRTPKSANGPRSNSFRPDSPLTTTSNRGQKTHPAPNTDPSIMVELLLYEPVLLIGAKSHPALENYDITHVDIEHPIFINVSELNDIPMIQYKNSYAEAALRQKSYAPKSVIKASSAPLALELAAKGVGFTSVIRSQLKYGRLIITQSLCPISIGDCKLPIYLAYNKLADKAIPEINRFIQEVKEEYCDASGL